jgi:hypothetical protein
LQVASKYVAGQTAIRLPAGVYRGRDAVRPRHSLIVSAHSSRRLLSRCRSALRLLAWEQQPEKKEVDWPEAMAFRAEFADLRWRMSIEAQRLGPIVGVAAVEKALGLSGGAHS